MISYHDSENGSLVKSASLILYNFDPGVRNPELLLGQFLHLTSSGKG